MKRNGEQRHGRSFTEKANQKRGRKRENKYAVQRTKHKTRLQCREPLLLIHPNMKTNRKKYVTGAKGSTSAKYKSERYRKTEKIKKTKIKKFLMVLY